MKLSSCTWLDLPKLLNINENFEKTKLSHNVHPNSQVFMRKVVDGK